MSVLKKQEDKGRSHTFAKRVIMCSLALEHLLAAALRGMCDADVKSTILCIMYACTTYLLANVLLGMKRNLRTASCEFGCARARVCGCVQASTYMHA